MATGIASPAAAAAWACPLRPGGELDEALRIRREEQLPVYEKLGDVRSLLVGRANLAIGCLQRGQQNDREQANALLCLALITGYMSTR